jgi:hypothetical protein
LLLAPGGAVLRSSSAAAGAVHPAPWRLRPSGACGPQAPPRRPCPTGHHAKRDLASAGSYFNNAAIAVRAAQAAGARRVMLVDWDVHHCAGTQSIFQDDPSVLLVSMHWLEQ